ncbi:MAG: hypothetical protein RL226_2018, partial [Bacteroidota bacterium]
NRDFKKLNADTISVVPEFENIIGKTNIEFRLATVDPLGNCTDGIDRINSKECRFGDFASKLNFWQPNRYLNIWVAKVAGSGNSGPGLTLAYATFPGTPYFLDGIMARYDALGPGAIDERTLTHEVGHYFGLHHPWGDGEIGTLCGDDGISDTPITKGTFGCNTSQADCDPEIVENVQNYMDYSSCKVMFTSEQSEYMRATLLGDRSLLTDPENIALTGADLTAQPLCVANPDFHSDVHFTCTNVPVAFFDASWNADEYTVEWTFEDGIPTTSTELNPVVQFSEPGTKSVTLTVSNASGSKSVTRDAIQVYTEWPVLQPTYVESFETDMAFGWKTYNAEYNNQAWEVRSNAGYTGDRSIGMKYHKSLNSNATVSSEDYWYYDRLEGFEDAIVSPPYDFTLVSGAQMTFRYAASTAATSESDITDELRFFVSTDCGETWLPRGMISGMDLITAGNYLGADYVPQNQGDWRQEDINLSSFSGEPHVMVMFRYIAGDKAHNIYIDDIAINASVGVDETEKGSVSVFPNPASEDVTLSVTPNFSRSAVQLFDISGRLVLEISMNGASNLVLPVSHLAPGVYTITLSNGTESTQTKFLKQ